MLQIKNFQLNKIVLGNFFCASLGIDISDSRNAYKGKANQNWISLDPLKAGPTLGESELLLRG